MSDYKERFEKWQRGAKEKFDEIDKQLGLKEKIGEGARVRCRDGSERRRKNKSRSREERRRKAEL